MTYAIRSESLCVYSVGNELCKHAPGYLVTIHVGLLKITVSRNTYTA